MRKFIKTTLLLLAALFTVQAYGLEIRHVQHDRNQLQTPGSEKVTVRFELSEPAAVTMNVYDGRDLLIRNIDSGKQLASGEHSLSWDGKDNAGRPVPPGAYHYTLVATDKDQQSVEYDLTDLTGGEDLEVRNVNWDNKQKTLSYLVQKPARVNIRIGLQNDGPLLRTLLEWVPRAAGTHQEKWDGMDASGVIDLSKHPKRDIVVLAFSLSDNSILVGAPQSRDQLVADMSWKAVERERKQVSPRRMKTISQQPLETRGDYMIHLTLPDGLEKTKEGLPVVTGRVPVRLDIADKDRKRALERRFEAGFYVDGIMVFENETGFLPMTWYWNTAGMNPGTHYLTTNVRGYEGNFGMQTVKLYVKPEGKAE